MRFCRWHHEMRRLLLSTFTVSSLHCGRPPGATPSPYTGKPFLISKVDILIRYSRNGTANSSTRPRFRNLGYDTNLVTAGPGALFQRQAQSTLCYLTRRGYTSYRSTTATVAIKAIPSNAGNNYSERAGFPHHSPVLEQCSRSTCSKCFTNSHFKARRLNTISITPSSVSMTIHAYRRLWYVFSSILHCLTLS